MARRRGKANSGSAGRNLPGQTNSYTRPAARVDRGGPRLSQPVPNPVITRLKKGLLPSHMHMQRRPYPKYRKAVPGEAVAEEAAARGYRMPERTRRYYTD